MQDSSTTFLGIDPGKTGAIAIIAPDYTEVLDTPTYDDTGELDPVGMSRIVGGLVAATGLKHPHPVLATLELAQAMPKQGVSSVFKYGTGYGIWIGILAAFRVPAFLKVRPGIWKKAMLPADVNRSDKLESVKLARRLFPDVDLGKRRDAGRAEALLIAEYGRRQYATGRF